MTHLAAERRVQQVFGVACLATLVGDESELVLDQRDEPVVAERCHQPRRVLERGPRADEIAVHALRGTKRAEQLADPDRRPVVANRVDHRREESGRGGNVARGERDVGETRHGFGNCEAAARRARSGNQRFEPGCGFGSVARGRPRVEGPCLGEPPGRRVADDTRPMRSLIERDVRGCVVAPVRSEVSDLGVVAGEEEPALETLGNAPELGERVGCT